jgi:hypothetical protein
MPIIAKYIFPFLVLPILHTPLWNILFHLLPCAVPFWEYILILIVLRNPSEFTLYGKKIWLIRKQTAEQPYTEMNKS